MLGMYKFSFEQDVTVLLEEMLTTSYREGSVLVAGSFLVEYNKLLVTIFLVVARQQSQFQTNQ